MKQDKVIIFDTTLRDGEQAPGASMNIEEKILIAKSLEKMGVDVIEAGFPAASNGDFEAVSKIAAIVKESIVCGLARAKENDIVKTAESIKFSNRPRIHTFIATSPIHMKYKLKMSEEKVLEAVKSSVKLARKYTNDVDWSAEDATRSDKNFLYKAIDIAIQSGATTINIPDTVGYTTPEEYYNLIKDIRNNVVNIDKVVLSTHCHDDLGMAVANSLAGLKAGARQIECTINGLGERAGNAALEEIVMAIKTRKDYYDIETNIDTTMISRISKLVSNVTGFAVQYNKAIVGANAFAHESGIHQDGMLKNRETYEIMTPASVGLEKTSLTLGKLSGKAAFTSKLKEIGYDFKSENEILELFAKFKNLADHKKEISDEDIIALVDSSINDSISKYKLLNLNLYSAYNKNSKVFIEIETDEGMKSQEYISENGPVDAVFSAIKNLIPHAATLELYKVEAVTEGTSSQATASVRLKNDGKIYSANASDLNVVVASAKAYINCLNKLVIIKNI